MDTIGIRSKVGTLGLSVLRQVDDLDADLLRFSGLL